MKTRITNQQTGLVERRISPTTSLMAMLLLGSLAVTGCGRAEAERQRQIAMEQVAMAQEQKQVAEAQQLAAEKAVKLAKAEAEKARVAAVEAEHAAQMALQEERKAAENGGKEITLKMQKLVADLERAQLQMQEQAKSNSQLRKGYDEAIKVNERLTVEVEDYARRLEAAKKDAELMNAQKKIAESKLTEAQKEIESLKSGDAKPTEDPPDDSEPQK